jgi:hypothetical protein
MNTSIEKILEWLKAGYPQGIPREDYPPVLSLLRRNLTEDDIESIADELALDSVSNGVEPITGDQIRDMVHDHVFQQSTPDDIRRVSAMLAAGGWPLAAELA